MSLKNDIEKLFADVHKIIFSSQRQGKTDPKNIPLITLIIKPEKMPEYDGKDLIPKVMESLYSRKSILLIDSVAKPINFSIADAEGKNPICMPNATYDLSFPEFLQKTSWHDKIFLLIAGFDDYVAAFNQDLKQNLFLILDGYSFA